MIKRPQVGPPRRGQLQLEVAQLRNKVKDLKVMLQKLQADSKPELEEEDTKEFLRRIVAKYTQSKGLQKKRSDF